MPVEIKSLIKRQHHTALAMFKQAVETCPDDLWLAGAFPRNTWRIAYHALAFFHLYLYPKLDSWKKWPDHRIECTWLEGDDVPEMPPYTREQTLEFIELIESEIDSQIDSLDFEDKKGGFTWYPNVGPAELQVLSLRHFHGHLGQIAEILFGEGLDVEWIGQLEAQPVNSLAE